MFIGTWVLFELTKNMEVKQIVLETYLVMAAFALHSFQLEILTIIYLHSKDTQVGSFLQIIIEVFLL